MTWRKFALAAAAALAAWTAPAAACTIQENEFLPSNYELVQLADAIVIATAERQEVVGVGGLGPMTFRVAGTLKGSPPGQVRISPARAGQADPSNLEDLSRAHSESAMGPCNRITFAPGQRYLLFLARAEDGEWNLQPYPFSRVNEDYAGEDDNWIRSVRRYARLQRMLGVTEQIAALQRMVREGRDLENRTLTAAERADIEAHLSSISPWKPTRYLTDLLVRAERGEALPVQRFSTEGTSARIARALAVGRHPSAAPLIRRLWAAPASGRSMRGPLLLYLARNGQYAVAYRWIATRLMSELPLLPREAAIALVRDVATVQSADRARTEPVRWRTDGHAAATWPDLAVALYSYQVAAFGVGWSHAFPDAFRAARPSDYRARPDVARALAHIWDEDVRRWAVSELARPPRAPDFGVAGPPRDWEPADLLPLSLLVSSWDQDHQAVLVSAFCAGGERRRLLIHALGAWGSHLHQDLLARMAATPGLGEEERSWLVRAAVDMAAEYNRQPWRTGHSRWEEERWLLSKLVRRVPVEADPITCDATNLEGAQR